MPVQCHGHHLFGILVPSDCLRMQSFTRSGVGISCTCQGGLSSRLSNFGSRQVTTTHSFQLALPLNCYLVLAVLCHLFHREALSSRTYPFHRCGNAEDQPLGLFLVGGLPHKSLQAVDVVSSLLENQHHDAMMLAALVGIERS